MAVSSGAFNIHLAYLICDSFVEWTFITPCSQPFSSVIGWIVEGREEKPSRNDASKRQYDNEALPGGGPVSLV